jgi:hypothetical protein
MMEAVLIHKSQMRYKTDYLASPIKRHITNIQAQHLNSPPPTNLSALLPNEHS